MRLIAYLRASTKGMMNLLNRHAIWLPAAGLVVGLLIGGLL